MKWTDLPRHVLVMAVAFALEGGRSPLRVAALLRGLVVQLVYRALCGEVLILPGRAVLVWSVIRAAPRSRAEGTREVLRRLASAAAASVVGSSLAVASFGAVGVPADVLLRAAGFTWRDALLIVLGLGAASSALTARRAVSAYRANRDWAAQMTGPEGVPTWRIDLLGAARQGAGHGGRLLDAFLYRAGAAQAQVYLVTSPEHRDFYRRHGLRTRAEFENGMFLMHRRLLTRSGPAPVSRSAAPLRSAVPRQGRRPGPSPRYLRRSTRKTG